MKSNLNYLLGFMNSIPFHIFSKLFSQGLSIGSGHISNVPFILQNSKEINSTVKYAVQISKLDWDAHETSWDFEQNELLALNDQHAYCDVMREYAHFGNRFMLEIPAPKLGKLEWLVSIYKTKWETKFMQLHANEEELNRQFIEIYGLQDELTPDVPLEEITILQQGEISIRDDNRLVWHEDVIIKQLISYAVGCMMGRYSIDKRGLILANQGDGLNEYEKLVPSNRFKIDDDGIIPLMSENSELNDNATLRFKEWLKTTFGESRLVDNLNYVEKCLGKTIDEYFVKDFWKDHKKMYQNRPIYWLFSSKNKAFQCITYMHRMDAYTAAHVRSKYLLRHIEWLTNKQREMQENAAALSARERRELDNITKQIADCREYDNRLHTVADRQINFDLDDGVIVNYAKFGDVLSKIK